MNIVSKIEFTVLRVLYSKQSGFKVSKYTYTRTYEEVDEEKAEEVRGREDLQFMKEKETRLLSLWGSNPSDNNKNTFRFSHFNSKWRERA